MFNKLFAEKTSPEITELLRQLIPPEVGTVSEEMLAAAGTAKGMGYVYQILNLKLPSVGKVVWTLVNEAAGTRYGRQVSVSIGMTRELDPKKGLFEGDKPCVITRIEGNAPDFEVTYKDKNPETMPLPPGVASVLIELGPLEKDIRVSGSSDGIIVFRKRSNSDVANWSKGTLQWLNDLRLAERLANVVWPS